MQTSAAITAYEALVAAQPGVPGYQHVLANSLHNFGLLQRQLGHEEDAVPAFREAVERRRVALEAAPRAVEIRQRLEGDYKQLGEALRALGRDREADEAAAEWKKIEARPGGSPPDPVPPARPLDGGFPADPFAR